jgi:hypothetical protein
MKREQQQSDDKTGISSKKEKGKMSSLDLFIWLWKERPIE